MSTEVRVELPSGEVVWASVRAPALSDVAAGTLLKLDADELRDMVSGVGRSLRDALAELTPDQVQIEFGLELAVKAGKVISVLAEAGAKASVKVSLTWSGAGPTVSAAATAADAED